MIYVVEQAGDLNSFLGRCQRAVFQVPGGVPGGGGGASSQEGQRREALQSLFWWCGSAKWCTGTETSRPGCMSKRLIQVYLGVRVGELYVSTIPVFPSFHL